MKAESFNQAEILSEQMQFLYNARKFELAKQKAGEALILEPANLPAAIILASSYGHLGKLQEAEDSIKNGLKYNPNSDLLYSLWFFLAWEKNQKKLSLEYAQKALEINPESPKNQFNMYRILNTMNPKNKIYNLKFLKESIRLDPNNPEYLSTLGNFKVRDGEYSEAEALFIKALKIDPNRAELHNDYGICLVNLGEKKSAVSHFATALKIDPNLKEARDNLEILVVHPSVRFFEWVLRFGTALVFVIPIFPIWILLNIIKYSPGGSKRSAVKFLGLLALAILSIIFLPEIISKYFQGLLIFYAICIAIILLIFRPIEKFLTKRLDKIVNSAIKNLN